ncbi:MAG TPA: HEAT repeat domain-containing protein, partial [Ktedonobacteraceae bacterium]|nr:HEAT repeat domain-containing protein [Ktedonobacteraceae bacterium]
MMEEQGLVTHKGMDTDFNKERLRRRITLNRFLRNIFIGVGIALALACVEGMIWIVNPLHLFGSASSHTLSTLLSNLTHNPLLWLFLLVQVIVVCALLFLIDKPLAIGKYIRDAQKEQERYRTLYTSLVSWTALYETPLTCYHQSPDLSTPGNVRELSILDQAQELLDSSGKVLSHQLVLGVPGAGKTLMLYFYWHTLLQRSRAIIFGSARIPMYVPLQRYNLFLNSKTAYASGEEPVSGRGSFIDFLYTSDLVGINHLRPFLQSLMAKGRIVFLCDGFNEIDERHRSSTSVEFAEMMRQSQNQLVLTCREVDYEQQPQLAQAVLENLVNRICMNPLDEQHERGFVEQYIKEQDTGKKWRHTAGQVMEVINRSRHRAYCTNPFMFFSLLEVIDVIGVDRGKKIDTRGKLLRTFVRQRIQHELAQQQWSNANLTESDVVLFLGELACAARWTNSVNALQVPVASKKRAIAFEDIAKGLQSWLLEHPAKCPSAVGIIAGDMKVRSSSLRRSYQQEELSTLLRFAQSASLIEISHSGILSFRHELLAAYYVAEYFMAAGKADLVDSSDDKARLASDDHWDIEVPFITPVALCIGLLNEPEEYAHEFILLGQQNPSCKLEALTLAFLCIGVAYMPPQADGSTPMDLTADLTETITEVVKNKQSCDLLAQLFTRFASEGAQEIYQSLFPLLMVDGIDEFILRLNANVVLELLFNQLCVVVDNTQYEAQAKRLVRTLGRFGTGAIPRATELSQPSPDRSSRLRSAAINILGGTNEQEAVEPLIVCLRDSNQPIVGRAANALIRLGPELSFTRLVQELEDRTPTPGREQVHWIVLHILERFQNEPDRAHQLTPSQHIRLVSVLLNVLTSNYAPEDQQKAREMLVRQAREAGNSPAGERAVEFLVQNLSSEKDSTARATLKTLKEVGYPATPYLLEQLKPQTPETVRLRIVEVLADVRDPRALPYLLRLLDDSALVVQQQVALALSAFAPESISGLIDCVLHGDSELVATRAEQILGDIGDEATNDLIQSLIPIVPGRTHLLVQVLERVRNPLAIPPLIAFLENPQQSSHVDQPLQVAVVHALGQFPDERVVAPLLEMLASSNPLIYEGAINALSFLEDVALDGLIAALDEERDRVDGTGYNATQPEVLAPRIERAILGMAHFPGERLLEVLATGSEMQVEHTINVFLAKGTEGAQVLVAYLFNSNARLQHYVRLILGDMSGQVLVPALLEIVNHPEPAWRVVITTLLLQHPREAIPPLVNLLDDDERADAAQVILLEFDQTVLPYLVIGLDSLNSRAQEHARYIVVTLVKQTPELVHEVVQLFNLDPPQRAHEALTGMLTSQLAPESIPALLEGLEDAHLIGASSEALKRLVDKDDAQSEMVLTELLAALRTEQRRHGAEITLVEIGEKAVPGVGNLITDPVADVAHIAQNILCELGVAAFSFIWAAYSDTANRDRRTAARSIFRRMPTVVIKDELVQLLESNNPEDLSMALALLIERINDEVLQADKGHEMVPALLEHVQTHSDEHASHRIVALLLLLAGDVIIDHMTDVLYNYPVHQQMLVHAFLLLGDEGVEALLDIFYDPDAPALLRAEVVSLLGILAPNRDIREYASMLDEYGLWAGQSAGMSDVLHPDRLAVSLRALGGLLVGGHWDVAELQNLRLHSAENSFERELYEILLGWRYSPQITMLENDLQHEREEHKQNVLKLSQEILQMHEQNADLEKQLESIQKEHGLRGEELDQANKNTHELQRSLNQVLQEKKTLQATLQRSNQEKQSLQ